MPGYGAPPLPVPSPASTIVHTTAASHPLPIHQINFPHSPSPIPNLNGPSLSLPSATPPFEAMETADDLEVPRFHKLTFPTFDGKTDPLGWLNKCEQFFRGQHTRENTKVWLASFHLTEGAQQWYDMLERDAGGVHNIPWPTFRSLCQQRFGPALGTNHLSDLARLPFPGTVDGFIDAFQQRLAHAGSYQTTSGSTWSCRCHRTSNAPCA